MMNKQDYAQDLLAIRSMMARSSRFISLSGLSGVAAGCSALLGAFLAYTLVLSNYTFTQTPIVHITDREQMILSLIATGTLLLAIASGLYFTARKSKTQNIPLWGDQSKRLLLNLSIPLVTGGLVCLILLLKVGIAFLAPITLIFYGLALVNASKYALDELRSLGLLEISLGLIGLQFLGIGLWLWIVGFGMLHIAYGLYMYKKYDA